MAFILTHPAVTITTAGVPKIVSTTRLYVSSVIFQADSTNTGKVYFGSSGVNSSTGIALSAGEQLEVSFDNQYGNNNLIDLSTLYFDTDTNGNVVRVAIFKWITSNALSESL